MKLSDWLSTTKTKHEAFAEEIGVRQASVTRYANGSRIPRREQMEAIFKATDGMVTPADFFSVSP